MVLILQTQNAPKDSNSAINVHICTTDHMEMLEWLLANKKTPQNTEKDECLTSSSEENKVSLCLNDVKIYKHGVLDETFPPVPLVKATVA